MQCPRCFFENAADARWCGYCGHTLAAPAADPGAASADPGASARKRETRLGTVPLDDPFKAVAVGLRGGAADRTPLIEPTKDKVKRPKPSPRDNGDRRSTVVESAPSSTGFGEVVGALLTFGADGIATANLLRTGRFRIGRDPENELVIDDPRVSAFHAIIRGEPGRAFVLDTSTNGTQVGGALLRADRAEVSDGTVIEIGDTAIVVQLLASDTLDILRSSGS